MRDAQLVPDGFVICPVFAFKGMLARVQRGSATEIPKIALHAPWSFSEPLTDGLAVLRQFVAIAATLPITLAG